MSQPSQKRAPYDSLWRALPEEVTLALVRTLIPAITAPLTPWKTDLAVVTDREIDGSFLVKVDGAPMLLHLEYQNYVDDDMPQRMHDYISTLEQQYRHLHHTTIDVIGIVIWAVAGQTPKPVYRRRRFGKVICYRDYFDLHLPQLDWHTVDPLLLVLAPYLQGVKREDLETIALQLYAAAPPGKQATLLGSFLALSERKFADFAEIEQAILQKVREQMNEILQAIAESSYGVAILERGKAEGKAEGLQSAVQILWQSRFGTIPDEIAAGVQGLTEEQLRDLLALFATAPTEGDVRTWLQQHRQ